MHNFPYLFYNRNSRILLFYNGAKTRGLNKYGRVNARIY